MRTARQRKQALDMVRAGLSYVEVGRQLGIPPQRVGAWAKREGFAPRRKVRQADAAANALALVVSTSLSYAEIGRVLGIAEYNVRRWAYAAGCARRKRGRREQPEKRAA